MLCKLNKKDYKYLKLYKLIVLFNILNKMLKLIIIIKLNYLIEFNILFSKKQIKDWRIKLTKLIFKLLTN